MLIYDAVQDHGLDFSHEERNNERTNKDVPIEVKVSTKRYASRQMIRDPKLSLLFTPTPTIEVTMYHGSTTGPACNVLRFSLSP